MLLRDTPSDILFTSDCLPRDGYSQVRHHRLEQCRSGHQGCTVTNQMDQRGTLD